MKELENKVLTKIKGDKIVPHGKAYYKTVDFVYWLAYGLLIVLGGLALSIIVFIILSSDWDVLNEMEMATGLKILAAIPIFWICIVFLVGFLAYLAFLSTRTGYKKTGFYTAAGLIVLIAIGLGAYSAHLAEEIEEAAYETLPIYRHVVTSNHTIWDNPQAGYIAGQIETFNNDQSFTIKDFRSASWVISGQNINYLHNFSVSTGTRVKIIGHMDSSGNFTAVEVRPW